MTKKFVLTVVLICFAFSSGCAALTPPQPLKIMFASPEQVPWSHGMRLAAQMAFEEFDGKIGNTPIELVAVDGGAEENLEITAIDAARTDSQVIAYVGAYTSAHARELIPVANALGLAVISPSATWPGLTKSGYGAGEPGMYYPSGERMFFRVVPSDDIQGRVAAQWLDDQNLKSIYIIGQENPYSVGLTNLMLSNSEDFGITVAGTTTFDETTITDAEIQDLVATIDAAGVDAIYYPVVVIDADNSKTYDLLTALHGSNPTRPIMGADGLIGGLRDENSTLTNVFATSFQIDLEQTPEIVDFVAAFAERNDITVTVSDYYTIATYEAMRVVLNAIARAGDNPTRASVLQALRATDAYQGILGQWSFDDNGDTTYTGFGVMTIENGIWVTQ